MRFDVGPVSVLDCCNGAQRRLLGTIGVYVVVILVLWPVDRALLPFKLLAVLIHECSHAAACWVTGGTVESVEVRVALVFPPSSEE